MRRALTRNAKCEHELACYLCCAPAGTTDEDLIRVAGSRWAIDTISRHVSQYATRARLGQAA